MILTKKMTLTQIMTLTMKIILTQIMTQKKKEEYGEGEKRKKKMRQ